MNYWQLNDGVCVGYSTLSAEVIDDNLIPALDDEPDRLGWTYDSGWQQAPVPVAPSRRITSIAFRRRFTQAEEVNIEFASLDDPSAGIDVRKQQTAIRVYLKKVDAATFVDLDDPEVQAGLAFIEAAGLIAAGRGAAVLGAPVQPEERPT